MKMKILTETKRTSTRNKSSSPSFTVKIHTTHAFTPTFPTAFKTGGAPIYTKGLSTSLSSCYILYFTSYFIFINFQISYSFFTIFAKLTQLLKFANYTFYGYESLTPGFPWIKKNTTNF